MEMLDSIIKFVSSYPTWAKAALILCTFVIVGILVFSPRQGTTTKPAQNSSSLTLRIEGVELFPSPEAASTVIQVTADVNGTKFVYPSMAGVEWLEVAPTMAGQSFHLPLAEQYELRFEVRKRAKNGQGEARLLSVDSVMFSGPKDRSRYSVHGFDPNSKTRSGTIDAEIIFSVLASD